PALVAPVLGPDRTNAAANQSSSTAANSSFWAASRFRPYAPPPVPVSLAVPAPFVDLGGGLRGRDARLTLALGERGLSLTQASVAIAGGSLGGDWRIDRDGGLARSSLRLSAQDIELKGLLPGASIAGRVSGGLELTGAGETVAQIVSSSGGGG